MLTLEEFYNYLEYLQTIGLDNELLSSFERIVTCSENENPYMMLDSILPFIGRSNYHVYSYHISLIVRPFSVLVNIE